MTGKVALVTGGNRGIGLEVARQLVCRGCRVWLGARDPQRGAAAVQTLRLEGEVRLQQLDVTSDESVTSAAAALLRESGRLDILINNAGVALEKAAAPSKVNLQVVRDTFEVNVFGCIRVTQAFLPLLKRSTAGRVVMVSSDMGSHAHQSNPAFPCYR
jgi:NAD(P)-dependent dehydrogenase (short-subunit alcohol dehydrogenase family)